MFEVGGKKLFECLFRKNDRCEFMAHELIMIDPPLASCSMGTKKGP